MASYSNIVQGGAAIEVATTDLGYIKDGAAIAVSSEMMYHMVEGINAHVGARNPQQNYDITTSLSEATLTNWALAWDWQETQDSGPPVTLEFGTQGTSSSFVPTEAAVEIFGYVPGGSNYTRTILLDRCIAVPGGEFKSSDGVETVIPITYHALYCVTNTRIGVISDAQS